MKNRADISSTEELLDLIKRDSASGDRLTSLPPEAAALGGSASGARGQASDRFLASEARARQVQPSGLLRLIRRRQILIGVEIGSQYIRLAKIVRSAAPRLPGLGGGSDASAVLVDMKIVSLSGDGRGDQDLVEPLRAALAEFIWPDKNASIWASMPAAGVTVWRTLLPRTSRKQLVNAALWAARRERKLAEPENVIDFQIEGEVLDKGASKLAATMAAAPRAQVEDVKSLFQKAGFPLAGLTIEPFALQNLFEAGWIKPTEQTVAILHVGRKRSRIDIFEGKRLLFTRAIMAGMNSMLEALLSELEQAQEEPSLALETEPAPEADKETSSAQLAQAERVLRSLGGRDADSQRTLDAAGLTREGVLLMIEPALDRLARQVERTFDHFSAALGRGRVERVCVCGEAGAFPGVVSYLEGQLGLPQGAALPFEPEDPAVWGEADVAPDDRAQLVTCVGLAHSRPGLTPNFLFTKRDEASSRRLAAWNLAVAACFAAAVLGLTAFSMVLRGRLIQTRTEIVALQERLAAATPLVDRALLAEAAEERRRGVTAQARALQRGYASAFLAELAALAPVNIRLVGVQADFDRRDKTLSPDQAGRGERRRTAVVEGISFGGRDVHAATLAEYLLRLRASPLMTEASAKEGGMETCPGFGEGQRFTLTLRLK